MDIRENILNHRCVGCGYCCFRQTCTFGLILHPEAKDRVCPELRWNGSRYVCRLVEMSGSLGTFYREYLKVGQGCRAYANPWRKDVRCRDSEKPPLQY